MPLNHVASFPSSLDLSPLLNRLQHKGVVYRVTEEEGEQYLWLTTHDDERFVLEIISAPHFDAWMSAEAKKTPKINQIFAFAGLGKSLLVSLKRFPVSMAYIALGILGALLVHVDERYTWINLMLFQPLIVVGDQGYFYGAMSGFKDGELWRLITPIFLHFGVLHIVFNALWVWEFGRRIETIMGTSGYLLITLLIAGLSNWGQYLWEGPSVFGGLSGVVYGFMGWLWVHHKLDPSPLNNINPPIVGLMMFWLILCMTGAIDGLIGGSVANAAHLGGLMVGAGLGVACAYFRPVKDTGGEV